MKEVDMGEPTSFLDPHLVGLHTTRIRNEQRCYRHLQKFVWIQDFSRKATQFKETWRRHLCMVLWYGRSCKELCRASLRAGEQNNPATLQSYNSMLWWPFIYRRIGICWRIAKSMLSNCLEIIACNWHALVDQTFYGQSTNIHEQSPTGPELVTNVWLV